VRTHTSFEPCNGKGRGRSAGVFKKNYVKPGEGYIWRDGKLVDIPGCRLYPGHGKRSANIRLEREVDKVGCSPRRSTAQEGEAWVWVCMAMRTLERIRQRRRCVSILTGARCFSPASPSTALRQTTNFLKMVADVLPVTA